MLNDHSILEDHVIRLMFFKKELQKPSTVTHACNPNCFGIGVPQSKANLGKSARPYLKNSQKRKAWMHD
jgi:hypothetical protein